MADNPVLDRVSGFAAQPAARQVSLLAGFAASIALAIGVVNWASTPPHHESSYRHLEGRNRGRLRSLLVFQNKDELELMDEEYLYFSFQFFQPLRKKRFLNFLGARYLFLKKYLWQF